jgi:predicted nucleotidyltransferase
MPYEPLTKVRLTRALRRLGELAQARKLTLEVSLYGGAVFTLVYGSRDSTRDVDAIVRPSVEGQELAAAVAREQDLPEDWLNSYVRQFLSPK